MEFHIQCTNGLTEAPLRQTLYSFQKKSRKKFKKEGCRKISRYILFFIIYPIIYFQIFLHASIKFIFSFSFFDQSLWYKTKTTNILYRVFKIVKKYKYNIFYLKNIKYNIEKKLLITKMVSEIYEEYFVKIKKKSRIILAEVRENV